MQPASQSIVQSGDEVKHIPDESSGLYKVARLRDANGARIGIVINLTDIWCPIDVVPAFGKKCPANWTADTAIELAKCFYVNPFYDRETYERL